MPNLSADLSSRLSGRRRSSVAGSPRGLDLEMVGVGEHDEEPFALAVGE
jgi:hypothetical protein